MKPSPQQITKLASMHAELNALKSNTRVIQTEADRAICNWLLRFTEVLMSGETVTEPQARHHV